jgi:hypothetical protein
MRPNEVMAFATEVSPNYNSEVIHTTIDAGKSCGGLISPAEGRGPITQRKRETSAWQ